MSPLRATLFGILGPLLVGISPLRAQAPQQLLDINPGPSGSNGAVLGQSPRTGEVLFVADDGVNGQELWRTDGTSANTQLIADLSVGSASTLLHASAVTGARAVVVLERAGAWELWSTNGTPGNMTLLVAAPAGVVVQSLLWPARDGSVYFAVGQTTWRTDGTLAGTYSLNVPWGYLVGELAGLDVLMGGGNVSVSDGATATVLTTITGFLQQFDNGRWLRRDYLMIGMTPFHYLQWVDGPGAPQITVNAFFLDVRAASNGFVIVTSDDELLVWNGAPVAQSIGAFDDAVVLGSYGGEVVLQIDDGVNGSELWLSDGTFVGTRLVDLEPGPGGSAPSLLGELDGRMLLWADIGPNGREPWLSDGTVAGTTTLGDLAPGAASSSSSPWNYEHPERVAGGQRRRVLRGGTPATGLELIVTDGTPAGTALLADINPGPALSSNGGDAGAGLMMLAGDAMIWFADDGVSGYEPWVLPLPGTSNRLRDYGPSTFTTGDPVLGASVDLSMTDIPNGQVAFVMLGEPLAGALLLDGLRALHLDPATAVVAAVAVPSSTGAWSGALSLPNVPSAVGLDLVVQPVLLPASTPLGVRLGAARWWSLGF